MSYIIRRPPVFIKHDEVEHDVICNPLVKDTTKIEAIKKMCGENGLDCVVCEDAQELKTRIVIEVPYKRKYK